MSGYKEKLLIDNGNFIGPSVYGGPIYENQI